MEISITYLCIKKTIMIDINIVLDDLYEEAYEQGIVNCHFFESDARRVLNLYYGGDYTYWQAIDKVLREIEWEIFYEYGYE